MVPSAICPISQEVSGSVARKHRVQAAPVRTHYSIGWIGYINQLAAGDGTCQRANLEPRRREVSACESAMHRSEVDVSPEPWEANAGGWRSRAAVIETPPFFCVSQNVRLMGRADRQFWPWSSRHADSD